MADRQPLKNSLLQLGIARIKAFQVANPTLPPVAIVEVRREDWYFEHVCAYYRRNTIHICIEKCARPGTAGRAWSWPGYKIDRTPYGVIAHEFGHHVDHHASKEPNDYGGSFGHALRQTTREPALTGYCPNSLEWFAEMFRLFVTNPDLLFHLRPRTFIDLASKYLVAEPTYHWDETLRLLGADERILGAARRQVKS